MHIRQMRGATPAQFSRATSPLLIACLYLADCKLLKLTVVASAHCVVSQNPDR